jgi:hypothetical protein
LCTPRAIRTCIAPIGPRPEHDDEVALLDADLLLGVDRAGERLRGRGLVEADALGDVVEPVDLEDRRRDDHVLGEAAVVLVPDGRLVLTDLHPALATLVAFAARHGRDDLDAVADLEAAQRVRADLDDLTGDLVTHRGHPGDVRVAVVADLDVGAAGGAVPDADLHLVGAARVRGRPRAARHRVRRTSVPSW